MLVSNSAVSGSVDNRRMFEYVVRNCFKKMFEIHPTFGSMELKVIQPVPHGPGECFGEVVQDLSSGSVAVVVFVGRTVLGFLADGETTREPPILIDPIDRSFIGDMLWDAWSRFIPLTSMLEVA